MAYETLLYERRERIAIITLNRPRYRNAQLRVLLEELDAAFTQARDDDEVRVIVLAGRGDLATPIWQQPLSAQVALFAVILMRFEKPWIAPRV